MHAMLHEWLAIMARMEISNTHCIIMFHPTPSHFPYRQPTSLHQSPQGYAKTGERSNKQLLDEVEHDIMNYQNRGLCYPTDPEVCVITQT